MVGRVRALAAALGLAGTVYMVADLALRPLAASVRSAQPEPGERPHSFALLIGDCTWKPPSPLAAVDAVLYFFGVGAALSGEEFVHNFHAVLTQQYVAAGLSAEQAAREVGAFDRCVDSYVPDGTKRPGSSEKTR